MVDTSYNYSYLEITPTNILQVMKIESESSILQMLLHPTVYILISNYQKNITANQKIKDLKIEFTSLFSAKVKLKHVHICATEK